MIRHQLDGQRATRTQAAGDRLPGEIVVPAASRFDRTIRPVGAVPMGPADRVPVELQRDGILRSETIDALVELDEFHAGRQPDGQLVAAVVVEPEIHRVLDEDRSLVDLAYVDAARCAHRCEPGTAEPPGGIADSQDRCVGGWTVICAQRDPYQSIVEDRLVPQRTDAGAGHGCRIGRRARL